MIHIIDANNLAGKLDLLDEEDFDKILVSIIKQYKPGKNHEFVLVFDSNDPLGGKIKDGRITIVYTPRDNYYKDADDKILEIAESLNENDVIVITDDIEIKEKVKKINLDKNLNIKQKNSTEFALELSKEDFVDIDSKLSKDDEEEINKELLEIWKK
jgi:hypothetical protein